MIKMFSGLIATLARRLFKPKGEVSIYRIILAITIVAAIFGLWTGAARWVIMGSGIADGMGGTMAVLLARWATAAWIAIVSLWPLASEDGDEECIVSSGIGVTLLLCGFVTIIQAAVVHNAFTPAPRTHYKATVTCEHCSAKCYVKVKIGESWTDWDSIECCRCGIKVSPKTAPEYKESREVWNTRLKE